MVMRPMVVRRRPLLRAAAIGGTFAAGRAMGRRAEEQQQAQYPSDQSAPAQAPGAQETSVMEQLSQLAAMHDQGALSDDEFAAAKAKILGS
jgi:hypothetical protein